MTKKEFVVEVYSADEGDILIWSPPKDLFPPIPIKKELVRCEDCKYYEHEVCHSHDIDSYINGDDATWFNPEPDFYCPFGRRKEEK